MINISLFFLYFLANFSESAHEPWGIDKRLTEKKQILAPVAIKSGLAQKACSASIHFFQNYISPIDGPRSTFYPTSSEYTRLMIMRHGALRGIALGCDRLMRENNEDWVYRLVNKHGVLRKDDLVHRK